MAKITFFEKTGCINNTKQKQILTLAGHDVEAINLLHHKWTKEELLSFFDNFAPKDWFNKNAPTVQNGETVPEQFSKEEALDALMQNHLLIRRPLMIIGETRLVGFDADKVEEIIGLNKTNNPQVENLLSQNLSDCPQKQKNLSCD